MLHSRSFNAGKKFDSIDSDDLSDRQQVLIGIIPHSVENGRLAQTIWACGLKFLGFSCQLILLLQLE